jgi:hypothetical protein
MIPNFSFTRLQGCPCSVLQNIAANYISIPQEKDRLSGLAVRAPGYRSRGPGFDSERYQFFWEVVGLERGPLSLVRIIKELLEWKSSSSSQKNRINDRGDPLRWPRDTLYPQKLALTSPTSGGRSVGIVRLRTKGHGLKVKKSHRKSGVAQKQTKTYCSFVRSDPRKWVSKFCIS